MLQKYDAVGVDLVAMCVNDVVVTGAEPLFFLDYIACGRLDSDKLHRIMKGIARGCREAGCALLGGETAELPGMYARDKLDLAGFSVGMVDRDKIIDGSKCRKGDKIIGVASTGLHSNGFSLVRKIFSPAEIRDKLGRELLRPTRIYVKLILQALPRVVIKAMAHITGGGFYGNIPRILPDGLTAGLRKGAWPVPAIFRKIQKRGQVSEREMFQTFNMGLGLVMIVSARSAARALGLMKDLGQKAWIIGDVVEGEAGVVILD
jgi:phosphoribosylformylglycinamidine cyclo-ligase